MATTSPSPPIPHLHLMIINDEEFSAFQRAREKYSLPPCVKVSIHTNRLSELDPSVSFDAIVSPANSYGRMDGGFDHALSRVFSPKDDYLALTRVVQGVLYEEWKGFAPPGTCTLVDLQNKTLIQGNWNCRYLAVCPTMRYPQSVTWDKEVVYECIWTLLAATEKHNRAPTRPGHHEIWSVLMTPLATLTGRWSADKWAEQLVLAIRHYTDAAQNKVDKWQAMDPTSIMQYADEIEKTHSL